MKDLNNNQASGACPAEELWFKVVAGLVDQVQATQLLKHAAQCHKCAELLKTATAVLASDAAPVPGLKSCTLEWQQGIARQMALNAQKRDEGKPWRPGFWSPLRAYFSRATQERLHFAGFGNAAGEPIPKRVKKRPFWLLVPVSVSAAALAVVFFYLSVLKPTSVDRLLGQAYAQNRTLEPRFSGALYGSLRAERHGSGESLLNESPALLEALPLISRRLKEEPNNPRWLDAKGRADLLGRNYDAAIKSFQRALETDPDSVSLLTDLASAYFERAQILDRPEDYGRAVEFLGRALAKRPDDLIALYNRALVNEKMFLFHQAAEDWAHYLQIDPKGEWAEEATRHLTAIRQKLREQERTATEPLLSPDAFVVQATNSDEQVRSRLEQRAEDYLDRALRTWLPVAFSTEAPNGAVDRPLGRSAQASFGTNRSGSAQSLPQLALADAQVPAALEAYSARLALGALAEMLRTEHGDHWLSDLLPMRVSNAATLAIQALGESVSANATGNFQFARVKAIQAAQLFRRIANPAGEIRARYELVYALHRTELGKRCLLAAIPLANRLPQDRYPWIQAQLDLELASCWAQIGNFDESNKYLSRALTCAETSSYGTLYLRALGIAGTLQTDKGNEASAYAIDQKGLASYWSGSYPPMRAYQFYSDLGFSAEEAGQWHLALALEKDGISAIALTEQRLGTALARQRLARVAAMVGDSSLANTEFERAKSLYMALPQTDATRTYQASGEIELAKLEIERGNTQQSSFHLVKARNLLPRIVNRSIALDFYQALGKLQQMKGNNKEAERAFLAAVSVAEWGFASLRSDRERATWARETGQAYRALAELHWLSGDTQGALRIWEWYRGAAAPRTQLPAVDGVRNRAGAHLGSSDVDFAGLETGPRLVMAEEPLQDVSAFHDATVLSYLQLPEGLAIWVFDDRGIVATWVRMLPQAMAREARHFRDKCADPTSDLTTLRKDARRLYDLLIGPVADHLSAQRLLVIEPDDTTVDIPMQALIDVEGRYLGERYAVVLSPGVLYQRHLRSAEKFSSRLHALAVGPPALAGDSAASLAPLEDAVQEAREVASRFDQGVLLTGAQATLPSVLEGLRGAVVFHFAGHSHVGVEGASLLLASSKTAGPHTKTAAVLDSLHLAPSQVRRLQLAVLSACSTAKEDEDSPGNPENLARAFLRGGVPHVVASRWNVNSKASMDFMHSFYSRLLADGSVPESLRLAANDLRSRQDTAHPYYWAAFTAFGR